MKTKRFVTGTLTLTLGVGALIGYSVERARAAGIPAKQPMTYSGVLTNANGTPLTGSKNIQLSIFDMATDGTLQCSAGPTAITLAAGGFQLQLPDTCTTVIRGKPDLWLEVFVDGATMGRTKLGAVPYAIEATHAISADTATMATSAANATNAATATNLSCGDPAAPAKYGFCIWRDDNGSRYSQTSKQAAAVCKAKGARLCSFAEVSAAWQAGAEWCAYGWVSDLPPLASGDVSSGYVSYPMQSGGRSGCHGAGVSFESVPLTNTYDANCCR